MAIELTPLGCRALLGTARPGAVEHVARARGRRRPGGDGAVGAASVTPKRGRSRFRACDEVLGRLVRDDSLEPALRRSWQLLVGLGGHGARGRARHDDRLDAPALRTPLRRRVRTVAEARGPRGALRARPQDAADAVPVDRAGRRELRLLRPGAPEPRLRRARRLPAGRLLARGSSIRPRRAARTVRDPERHEHTHEHRIPSGPASPTATPAPRSRSSSTPSGSRSAPSTRGKTDPAVVEHAELRWPLGGGVMLGTSGKDDSPFGSPAARQRLHLRRLRRPRRPVRARRRAPAPRSCAASWTRTTAPAASPSATRRATSGASARTPAPEISLIRAAPSRRAPAAPPPSSARARGRCRRRSRRRRSTGACRSPRRAGERRRARRRTAAG